jgi:UDP-glucuronate decarboxylase
MSSGKAANLSDVDYLRGTDPARLNIFTLDVTGTIDFMAWATYPWPDFKPREIYALASLASPVYYNREPVATALANTVGLRNTLETAKRIGARVLFTSTSEVYGDPVVHPQPETYNGNVPITGPRACYDNSKRMGETFCFDYRRLYGLEVRVARLFNVYGPGMQPGDGRVVSTFIDQALTGRALTVHSPGTQTRSLCYVGDIVEALIRLMESEADEPVNLGRDEEVTIKILAKMILDLTGSNSRITYLKHMPDDPARRRPSLERAKKWLNWEAKTSLRAGLEATILAAKAQLEAVAS